MSELVGVDKQGQVAVLTLNRPEQLNAVNAELALALGTALSEANADPTTQVIVITGAGRAFCAGLDLVAFAATGELFPPGHREWGFAGVTQQGSPKPLIAAVNGVAYGGGCEIALACDLVLASPAAKFALPEVRHGLMAAAGGTFRLTQLVGPRRALELLLTGEPIDADTAESWGLVNRVVPAEELLEQAIAWAGRIAANAPGSLRATKAMVRGTLAEPWADNDAAFAALLNSPDAAEGARAFAEHRPPRWTDSR